MLNEKIINDIAQLNKSLKETQSTLKIVAKSNLITSIVLGIVTITSLIEMLIRLFN